MSDRTILMEFDGMHLTGLGYHIPATCVVRNEVNAWRSAEQVVRTFGSTRPHGIAYQPRSFPPGSWEVTKVIDCHPDSAYWPIYIDTDAVQDLHEWRIDEFGRYAEPTGKVIVGRGYGIHHARIRRDGAMVPSGTTLGCINIVDPDGAAALGKSLREAFAYKATVYLMVPQWEDWK